jgi:hypothetical protein
MHPHPGQLILRLPPRHARAQRVRQPCCLAPGLLHGQHIHWPALHPRRPLQHLRAAPTPLAGPPMQNIACEVDAM